MRIHKVLAAATVGLAVAVSLAAPASAADMEWDVATGSWAGNNDWCASWVNPNPGPSTGCFTAAGDVFRVSDDKADGHSGAVYWQNMTANGSSVYRQGACVENRGNAHGGSCNKNFAEGTRVRIRSCTMEWATKSQYACGPWFENAYA